MRSSSPTVNGTACNSIARCVTTPISRRTCSGSRVVTRARPRRRASAVLVPSRAVVARRLPMRQWPAVQCTPRTDGTLFAPRRLGLWCGFERCSACRHSSAGIAQLVRRHNSAVLLDYHWSGRRDSNPRPQPWQGLWAVYPAASFSIPTPAKPLSHKGFSCVPSSQTYPPSTQRLSLSCFPPASPASAREPGEAGLEQVWNTRAGTDHGEDYQTSGGHTASR
jgi:hypothetical protein